MTQMETVKTSLFVRQDLFLKTRLLASVRGVSFTDLLNEALEQYLKEHEGELKEKFSQIVK